MSNHVTIGREHGAIPRSGAAQLAHVLFALVRRFVLFLFAPVLRTPTRRPLPRAARRQQLQSGPMSARPPMAAAITAAPEAVAAAMNQAATTPVAPYRGAPYPVEIAVPSTFSEKDYAALVTALAAPGSKLLDLSSARAVRPEFFTALASSLSAEGKTVPRLAIVLAFEHWACLRQAAVLQLAPLRARGVEAELFYEEQAYDARLLVWFSHGKIVHNVTEVLNTLWGWQPAPISPVVLEAAAWLVYEGVRDGGSAAHIVELARIALASGANIKALAYAREGLLYLGEVVSAERLEALQVLGFALLREGKVIAATGILDGAVAMAIALGAMERAADLLRQLGAGELDRGNAAHAERRFRAAIELLHPARSELLASLHHNLAIALLSRGKDGAEVHAAIALASRPDKGSVGAQMDVELLGSIRRGRGLAS